MNAGKNKQTKTIKTMKRTLVYTLAGLALAPALNTRAEEGGSAHYLPGATASFIDSFPGKPGGIAAVNYFTYYDASAGLNRSLTLGGLLTAGIDATVYADTITKAVRPFTWMQPWRNICHCAAVSSASAPTPFTTGKSAATAALARVSGTSKGGQLAWAPCFPTRGKSASPTS